MSRLIKNKIVAAHGRVFVNWVLSHAFVLSLIACYLLMAILTDYWIQPSKVQLDVLNGFRKTLFSVFKLSLVTFIFTLLLYIWYFFGKMLLSAEPKRPFLEMFEAIKRFIPYRNILRNVPLVLFTVVFFVVNSYFKSIIPVVNPFVWDKQFMELDYAFHFGHHPYELLSVIFNYPYATFLININYNLWLYINWAFWWWVVLKDSRNPHRMRFLICYFLTWSLGGSFLAMVFSSAGPCYYGLLGINPNPYISLMSYLNSTNELFPIWALSTQEMLWNSYVGEAEIYKGISAMPSMHNSVTVLTAITAFSYSNKLGWIMSVFAFFIFIGSVHLGWHYAIDGYVSLVLVFVLWWFSGKVVSWSSHLYKVK